MHTHPAMLMRTFIITLADRNGTKTIRLASPCLCDLAQWVADNAALFGMVNPEVVGVTETADL